MPRALKSCPKCNKSPNPVTLIHYLRAILKVLEAYIFQIILQALWHIWTRVVRVKVAEQGRDDFGVIKVDQNHGTGYQQYFFSQLLSASVIVGDAVIAKYLKANLHVCVEENFEKTWKQNIKRGSWPVVVAQLVERAVPKSEVCSSNADIGKFLCRTFVLWTVLIRRK